MGSDENVCSRVISKEKLSQAALFLPVPLSERCTST